MQKLKLNNKGIFPLILFFLLVLTANAQQFRWQATVDSVKEKGFYRIALSPEINGHLNNSFSDIRLFDAKNKEVPYLLKSETATTSASLFKEYKIVLKEIKKGSHTILVLEDAKKQKINNISLILKNSDVRKKVKLSGSDDQKTWYVVKEEFQLQNTFSNSETTEIKLLNFPLSNYTYYKIEINDSTSAPVNIISAGYYDTHSENGKYTEVASAKITQTDSVKKSYCKISFDEAQYIDKLELEIEGPPYYLRHAGIYELRTEQIKKRESRSYFSPVQEFDLSSNNLPAIQFSDYAAKELYLIIENEDNPPLKIKSVKGYQLSRYLTAYLDNQNQYVLKFGNEKLQAPNYDLNHFQDSIPRNTTVIEATNITELTKAELIPSGNRNKNKMILWIAIGIVALLLTAMSVKMIREMGKKEEQN